MAPLSGVAKRAVLGQQVRRAAQTRAARGDGQFDIPLSRGETGTESTSFLSPLIALQLAADMLDPSGKGRATHKKTVDYFYDPVGFVETFIDWGSKELASYQKEILARLVPYTKATGRSKEILDELGICSKNRRLAVRGPHGLGKTSVAALVVLWFSLTRDGRADWKAVTTASVWRQLTKYLWPEIHKWSKKIDWAMLGRPAFNARELLGLELHLKTGQAFAVASDDPGNIEGAHADELLYIFDEAKIIPDGSWDAIEGAFSGAGADTEAEAIALAISTPGAPNGRFYDIHMKKLGLDDWDVRAVSLEEAVEAKRISMDWATQRIKQWGGPKAVLSQNRVFGNFAQDSMQGVIPLDWVEEAQARWTDQRPVYMSENSEKPVALTRVSVDVARYGGDKTVIAMRYGRWFDELIEVENYDTMEVSGRIKMILNAHNRRPEIAVDVIGIGAGVFDDLRHNQYNVWGFNAAEGTELRDLSGELEFANKRAAGWWMLRQALDPQNGFDLALPPDDELLADLTTPSWRSDRYGRIVVEEKVEIRKRLGRSTDKGDAVVMAIAIREDEFTTEVLEYDQRVSISAY